MGDTKTLRCHFSFLALIVAGSLVHGAAERVGAVEPPPKEDAEACLSCHAEPDITLTFESGERHALAVDGKGLASSVHGKLLCTDCHAGFSEVPHPERHFKSLTQFRASFREACKECHFENYTKTLDSVHFALQARGDAHAPSCVGCHGSHAISRPAEPRSRISQTCATCHERISIAYARSVHGKALLEEDNRDVPVCTDCHHSHDIADARERSWRMQSPALCGRCHTDKKLMGKYGLSTNVLSSYLADFHGTTASFGVGRADGQERVAALCVDCHGIHDITKVKDPGSRVLQANLVKTCQKCHPGATETFPAAWLSHYEPSWERARLVYLVKTFYKVLIPFIVGGLILQILLHLWRVVVNR